VASAFYLLLATVNRAGIVWRDVKLSGIVGLYPATHSFGKRRERLGQKQQQLIRIKLCA